MSTVVRTKLKSNGIEAGIEIGHDELKFHEPSGDTTKAKVSSFGWDQR